MNNKGRLQNVVCVKQKYNDIYNGPDVLENVPIWFIPTSHVTCPKPPITLKRFSIQSRPPCKENVHFKYSQPKMGVQYFYKFKNNKKSFI